MNRKLRRAAQKQGSGGPPGDGVAQLFAAASELQRQNKLDEAARAYKRLLVSNPAHAQGTHNLGVVLLAQGKRSEASARFAQALTLMPQLLDQVQGVCATLAAVLPPFDGAVRRVAAAWPRRLSIEEMLGAGGLAAIAGDPLLLCLLRSGPVRDVAVERTFSALRAGLLARSGKTSDDEIAFACALAAQCFSNEYVFATTPQEEDALARLKSIAANDLSPMQVAGLAMYEPLHQIAGAEALLARKWPQALEEVLTQQLREPAQERALRAAMPRLTAIDDEVSLRVQGQYEENPYPRWVRLPGQIEPVSLATYLERAFPGVPFTLPRDGETLDMLIAGCGTGRQSILLTQSLKDVRVLAIDLSLASLGYAKRRTPPVLASRIDYAQADILKLPALGRSFDVIDAAAVLHHLADPLAGWRLLLGMLRPGGLMHLGFYSETGRRDVVKARDWIAERKFAATPADIRRCRQEILATPLGSVSRFNDFYSTSECRDMLFHVQETRVTIPAIEKFIADNGLRFLGFEFDAGTLRRYRALFAERGWSLSDLARWHALETENPDTFAAMYSFWVQKN